MKRYKMLPALLAVLSLLVLMASPAAEAAAADPFLYHRGDRLYRWEKITKGTTQPGKSRSLYQLVKISGEKLVLRPCKGFWMSDDPYFKKKTITLRISPKCRFYYTDVSFPQRDGELLYKRVTRKQAVQRSADAQTGCQKEYIDEAKGYYYTGGYFGGVYLKQGKVTAMTMNGGD